MLSATSKTSCRLCEIRSTARPCSPSRLTSSSTWRGWATPKAAVVSSRMTKREFHITALATATDIRWPPDSQTSVWRTERIVVTDRPFSVSAARFSMFVSSRRANDAVSSRPRNMFCTTSRLSASARSWYTTSIPSLAASFGPWMCTGWPSKRTSPPSIGWMPATHLISVDLPAPLSPTRAMTSPAETWKSTSCRAITAPKCFDTPRSSWTGVSVTEVFSSSRRVQPRGGGGRPGVRRGRESEAGVGAGRGHLTGADLLLLGEVRLAEVVLDVVLGHGDGLLEVRRHVLLAVVDRARHRGLLALGQSDGDLGGRVGLLLDRLVDRHALVAHDDVLDALERRVLAGDRDLLELALLQSGDRRVAEAVVGGQHTVDLVVGLLEHLLEDGQRLLVVPVRHRLIGDLLEASVVELRLQHAVIALLEQCGVVVGGRAVELGDLRRAAAAAQAAHEAL